MGAVITGDWQRGPVIGRGATATVSIAADRRSGHVFAVKSVDAAGAGLLRREQSVLSALGPTPYVVSCLGSGVSAAADGSFDLFLEYAPGGSLADEVKRRRAGEAEEDEEAWVRARAADVLRGLAHAHAAGVAHCDVKARNVLIGADGRAMLADFGCARWAKEEGNGEAGIRGTPAFMAPEAARGEAQGAAADVWALGCTVIEMATGAVPWAGRFADPVAALHHVAHSGGVPETPAWLSDEGKDFLGRCLARDPARRWTAEQLLQHPFVAESSFAVGKGALIEQRVSPKSILDQGFWEGSELDATAAEPSPADRVRALAGGVAPDWTWMSGDEDWIAVFTADIAAPAPQSDASATQFDADTEELLQAAEEGGSRSEEPHIGGGGGEQHMGADAASSRGRDHGHGASSSAVALGISNNECGCSGNSASESSNKVQTINLRTRRVGWLTPRSELAAVFSLFPLPRAFFHLSGGRRPFRHVPGVSRNSEVVVTGSLQLTIRFEWHGRGGEARGDLGGTIDQTTATVGYARTNTSRTRICAGAHQCMRYVSPPSIWWAQPSNYQAPVVLRG